MELVNIVILNSIYVLFPILLYFLFMAYSKNLEIEEKNMFLEVSLLISLYLVIEFGKGIVANKPLLIIEVPLLISFIKKNDKLSLFFSIVLMGYKYINYESPSLIILLCNYLITYIVYILLKDNIKVFFRFFILYKSIFFIIVTNIYGLEFINCLITVISFIIVSKAVVMIMDCADNVMNLFMSIKELEKEKQIKTSLFKISHEIKNPIAVCKGYLELMDGSQQKYDKYVPIIREEIEHTLLILHDFSSISKTKIETDIIDINFLIDEMVNSTEQIIKVKGIDLNYKYDEKEIYINGDYMRLKQVFINIIKNAIEALDNIDNPKIRIRKKVYKGKIYIYIEDNGCGITEDDMIKLKQAFFTTKPKGTGLGVYLSNEIIEAHKGKLNYQNINPGTRVEIIFDLYKKDRK